MTDQFTRDAIAATQREIAKGNKTISDALIRSARMLKKYGVKFTYALMNKEDFDKLRQKRRSHGRRNRSDRSSHSSSAAAKSGGQYLTGISGVPVWYGPGPEPGTAKGVRHPRPKGVPRKLEGKARVEDGSKAEPKPSSCRVSRASKWIIIGKGSGFIVRAIHRTGQAR